VKENACGKAFLTRSRPLCFIASRIIQARRFSDRLHFGKIAPRGKPGSHEKGTIAEEQMVKILREADQTPLEVAKKHRISDATVYLWRKRYGELAPLDVKRLRHLEQENAKLEKLAAERDLEIEVMKQLASSGNNPDKAIS
jgi:putative transposase